jgi:hypothetical protein
MNVRVLSDPLRSSIPANKQLPIDAVNQQTKKNSPGGRFRPVPGLCPPWDVGFVEASTNPVRK